MLSPIEERKLMRAIIPVAGIGSRLRPHTYSVPKVLLNVAGKPIIGHILDKIIDHGFTQATIVIGYMGDMIRDYVLGHYKIKVDFIEQEERLGLGHAIYLSRHTISRDPILIILGDTIFDVDLKGLVDSPYTVLGVKEVEDPRRFGVAETKDGFITKLVEKPDDPKSNLAIVGLYYIAKPQLLLEALKEMITSNIRTKGEYQLTDALQIMIGKGEKMKTHTIKGWFDCGKPETLLSTNRHLLGTFPPAVPHEGVVIRPPVFISPTAVVKDSVIGPYATVADGASVEHSIVENSIVSEGARVQDALLRDSILGNNAFVRGSFKRVNIGDSSELLFS